MGPAAELLFLSSRSRTQSHLPSFLPPSFSPFGPCPDWPTWRQAMHASDLMILNTWVGPVASSWMCARCIFTCHVQHPSKKNALCNARSHSGAASKPILPGGMKTHSLCSKKKKNSQPDSQEPRNRREDGCQLRICSKRPLLTSALL